MVKSKLRRRRSACIGRGVSGREACHCGDGDKDGDDAIATTYEPEWRTESFDEGGQGILLIDRSPAGNIVGGRAIGSAAGDGISLLHAGEENAGGSVQGLSPGLLRIDPAEAGSSERNSGQGGGGWQ